VSPVREDLRSPFAWRPRTPFWSLVAYFLMRMFAAEGEQSDEGMSLGLGVVLRHSGFAGCVRVALFAG
jgi:hypothetical protein